jgi:hypothetical protein
MKHLSPTLHHLLITAFVWVFAPIAAMTMFIFVIVRTLIDSGKPVADWVKVLIAFGTPVVGIIVLYETALIMAFIMGRTIAKKLKKE